MPHNIETHPLHLGLGATALPQPEFSGQMQWYDDYSARTAPDGAEGRLVTLHSFAESWTSWEMHPAGDEAVICMAGRIVMHQEFEDGSTATVTLNKGDYIINPPGCWHTADVTEEASAIFITAGMGTVHRAR